MSTRAIGFSILLIGAAGMGLIGLCYVGFGKRLDNRTWRNFGWMMCGGAAVLLAVGIVGDWLTSP